MRRCGRPRDDRGVSAVFFGLIMVVLIAGMGLSIDIGNVAYQRSKAQNAVDNAARDLARSCAQEPGGPDCSGLQGTAVTIASQSLDGGTVTATRPTDNQVKVSVEKSIDTPLLGAIGISSKRIAATATASSQGGHPVQGYPVLPLGVSYCTWKNNSSLAGTTTEGSQKISVRTDTLQSVRSLLQPVTGNLASVVELGGLLNGLGTSANDSCTDIDGTQLLTFKGGVWLTGENVLTTALSGLFGYNKSRCRLNVGSDLNAFIGGVEGAAFFPTDCASKFGPGKEVAVGKTILLPIYKPKSTLQNKYGFKLTTCVGLGSRDKDGYTCAEVPPKIGIEIVGYAPFTVTGWKFPSTPAASDPSVGCPSSNFSLNLYNVVNSTFTVLERLLNGVLSLLGSLLGLGTLTASLSCNGLQGYFTQSFSKDPNFQYSTDGADFGANYVKLTD